ncbi:hypothetical protein CLOSTASPAR_03422 [[Clostridium] asparagiforme DSM 15981]|uniref:Uncharacterized protein n=1 Tax=[Clostridium] asparagiforme DSM 15981 TaxID=518636 RepID=C0D2D2_9FIRM|nr:hypothetical protein CLOSTASPAR_03422 [[Clostridium] asparagiforme DSM 15981]
MHQPANLWDDQILLLQKFLVLFGKVVVQPVFDQYLSAVEVMLLIIIKAQAVFKIPSTLTRPHRERVKAAGSRAGSIDAALVFAQKNTSGICADRFEYINGITFIGKRHGFAVSEQHIVRAADTAMLVTQVLSHPVGIQALNHHAIFNMTAAMTAATAVI